MTPRRTYRTDHVRYVGSLDKLDEIRVRGVNLCIIDRRPPDDVIAALDVVTPRTFTIDASSTGAVPLALAISMALDCDDDPAWWLAQDIVMLRRRFVDVSGDPAPRVLFECETDEACTLLHVDALPMRLLTVYAGSGSIWAPNDAVRRRHLGTQDDRAVCPDADALRRAERFAVLLFKGEQYPGEPDDALVHRSPPVPAGTVRIKLRINRAYG